MAASSVSVAASAVRSPKTGLRPEPQSVCTQAAGAALKIGVEARSLVPNGKSVFDRHSTQSAIAPRPRREPKRFSALPVDRAVYLDCDVVYASSPVDMQVPECAQSAPYTDSRMARARRA